MISNKFERLNLSWFNPKYKDNLNRFINKFQNLKTLELELFDINNDYCENSN